jgi:hypothetical protein
MPTQSVITVGINPMPVENGIAGAAASFVAMSGAPILLVDVVTDSLYLSEQAESGCEHPRV